MPEYLPRSATFIYTTLRFQRRFQPVVIAAHTTNLDEFPLDAPVVDVMSAPPVLGGLAGRRWDRRYEAAILAAARDHGCSLLHAHFGWSGRACLRTSRQLDLPLITTFYGRDLAPGSRRGDLGPPYRRLFREGRLFVCEGPVMAKRLEQIGCDPDRIRVVKIGLDLSQLEFQPAARSEPLILIQIARLVEKKGADLTIKGYAEACRHGLGPSELWLIGDGDLRPQLQTLAAGLGVARSVRFLGERSHEETLAYSRRAHICVQPSRTASDGDTEGGAPTVLLELQALGKQLVTSRHADIPNVVADEDALVDEEDVTGIAQAILRLSRLSDADWARRAARARSYVEDEHDARRIADRLAACYGEALATSARPPAAPAGF